MLNKIPHNIVSRYYSANLGYMTQMNLLDFFKRNPDYFNESSILVKKWVIDLKETKEVVKNQKKLQPNGMLSTVVHIEEWLRRMEENQ